MIGVIERIALQHHIFEFSRCGASPDESGCVPTEPCECCVYRSRYWVTLVRSTIGSEKCCDAATLNDSLSHRESLCRARADTSAERNILGHRLFRRSGCLSRTCIENMLSEILCDTRDLRCDLDNSRCGAARAWVPRVSPSYTAQARVQAHKKYVIWLTGGGPDQISDACDKGLFDLRSQLADRP